MRDIGKNIKDLRMRKNMTQDELAEKLFVTRQTVSKLLNDALEEKIVEIFIESANSGEKTELEPKIDVLKKLAEEGRTPFSERSLSEYLSGYNGEMVSHSEKYRKAYAPAYRVVMEKLAENLQ